MRARRSVANEAFKVESEKKSVAVTASFGLCGLDRVPSGEQGLADRILKIADAALYRSKHSGRNRLTATVYGGASGGGGSGRGGERAPERGSGGARPSGGDTRRGGGRGGR